ncbi:MAG: ribokinase [Prosthecobacter sp.]|jgi:ribokinase|uniref:ribokinase n=1 Tax=Prosthecobacter sp. TaxID=1965333 RepID=UPI0019E25AB8|nr:ribokinase [Prosthecobacter sp.]MBE2283241.1 ribokinase [Prosthecobacter sp.]
MPVSSLVVLGSSNTDMIVRTRTLPRPGETVLGGEFITAAGGKGANQAVAARRAGGSVSFIARIGSDAFGDQSLASWRSEGIDITHVTRDAKAASGVALILVDENGENSIAVAGGANQRLTPAHVRKAAKVIRGAHTLLMQLETPLPTIQAAAEIAAKAGVRVILNPAPAQPLPAELLRQLTIITPNETEAETLTGIRVRSEKDCHRAANALQKSGVRHVIITLGARGAFLAMDDGTRLLIPSFPVQPVDTTAAGDTFNGALAVALGENHPLPEAIRFANAAAALSITRLGAQPSAPKRREIVALLRRG